MQSAAMNTPNSPHAAGAPSGAVAVATPSQAGPLLDARGITRTFVMGDKRLEVLKGVDMALASGDFVAISGSSGAGKSTLLHILGLLDSPDAGTIAYKGSDLAALDPEKAARVRNREFGFVFQFFHLLPEFSALDNVMMPARLGAGGFNWFSKSAEARDRAESLLARVKLDKRMGHLPNQLSGGERQRVAIARALMNKPAIVFCDEPTGNLDSATASDVFSLLRELNENEGQTFLIVTHDAGVAARVPRQLHMRDGVFV